jgi:hypothetical protein
VQALALGTLFVLYARIRWGRLLAGPVTPAGSAKPAVRTSRAVLASCVALLPGLMHGMWAVGADFGLNSERRAAYSADSAITEAAFSLFVLLTVTGLLLDRGDHTGRRRRTGHRAGGVA